MNFTELEVRIDNIEDKLQEYTNKLESIESILEYLTRELNKYNNPQ